ncbi:Uu.00g133510.m01.CDS01 [Anthostomella pinea]|uniref:Uu.00g133510.m01.CDS01 n=1 Tax=Anthostomella pinea TaxID=933095 RepID=A0AAI8YKP9_9PEZI|nr:Uu.00g133510.m01.CDS01 [Anthostomella pinea]
MGDVRSDGAFAARLLTDKVSPVSHALFSLYRLASNPGGRFPAALQDAITAYHYLLNDLAVPASRIVLSGDSAGGHIMICMLRYLAEHHHETALPPPRAVLLWSPAVDMVAASKPETVSGNRNYANDYLDPLFVSWGARRFVTDKPAAASYLNPLGDPFKSPCPMWVFCGGNEIFCDEITRVVEEMKSVKGTDATLKVERLANHDIFFAGNLTGWKTEAEQAATEAGKWLEKLPPV